MYGDDYDLVGCIVGVVAKERMITGERIRPGHTVIGLASNGLHTNGFSLARKILFDQAGFTVASRPAELGQDSVGAALLRPHVCYWPAIHTAMDKGIAIDGMAHLTGGGFYENIPRVLPQGVAVECRAAVLPVPPIMTLIQAKGKIDPVEMHRVFNMGVGMVWMVPETGAGDALACCEAAGIQAAVIGKIVRGNQDVTVRF